MIKLIAIDLDGTLLHEDKTLSKGNIEALHRAHEAGYDIVICTGRPLAGVRPIFEEIGLPDGNYYMIINNGCTTLSTKNWEIISWKCSNSIAVWQIVDVLKTHAFHFRDQDVCCKINL